MDHGYPDISNDPPLGRRNVVNAILTLAVPVPAIACVLLLFGWFPAEALTGVVEGTTPTSSLGDRLAASLLARPLLAANLFFLVFVDLAFFAIALVQRSSWLIDPYWTLLPPLLALFLLGHPLASPDPARAALAGVPLLIWSGRLTHNYFRREGWRFGLREDWRYAKMRRERPHFWLEQLVVVHLTQHAMLVGLSLPFWAVAFRGEALGALDGLAATGAVLGIGIAWAADDQLDRFMRSNDARRQRGEPVVELLDTGIWRYSRHPNYFGEQLFWWSIALFGVACGEPWVVVGTLLNSCVLAAVTVMTERRMRDKPSRREAFEEYRRRTSVWIPWPPRTAVPAEGPASSRTKRA